MNYLSEGLAITVFGVGTVFAILFLLYIVMVIMGRIFYRVETNSAASGSSVDSKKKVASVQVDDEMDEEELVAVLTAAIAASLNQSTYNLNIKSYRRIPEDSPVWNRVGRTEQLESRIIR